MTSKTLFEKIENCKPIDFGNIFNNSIELFKKVWLQGFVHLLISIVVMMPLFFVLYIPFFAMVGVAGYEYDFEQYVNQNEGLAIGLMGLFIVFLLIILVIAMAFQFGITAHFYKVCKQVDLDQPETSSYFMFFKIKYFIKIILLTSATFGITLLAAALCYLPIFYVIVPLQLLGVLFAFNPDISASDLIKASFKLGNKIWLVAFGLIIIASILSQLAGMMLCFVGIFFTASFVYLPIYYMYKDTVGFDDDDDIDSDQVLLKS